MKFESGAMSVDHVKGFVKIDEFKGQSTLISLDMLKQFVEFLKVLKTLDFTEIEIGVENGKPLLIFLNEEKTMALGLAPIRREKR